MDKKSQQEDSFWEFFTRGKTSTTFNAEDGDYTYTEYLNVEDIIKKYKEVLTEKDIENLKLLRDGI
jgi:hypothetical protein